LLTATRAGNHDMNVSGRLHTVRRGANINYFSSHQCPYLCHEMHTLVPLFPLCLGVTAFIGLPRDANRDCFLLSADIQR
jgi:hypothetical protein